MKKVNYTTETVPSAYVTKGRHRVKQYDDTVYLKNGDEFEIELFNPKQNKILARIILDGKELESGIVLRPGERVFLERYLTDARKFLFETYEVDASNESAQKAIENNGNLKVKFYDELDYNRLRGGTITHTSTYTSPWYGGHSTGGVGKTTTETITFDKDYFIPCRGTTDVTSVMYTSTMSVGDTFGMSGTFGRSGTSGMSGMTGASGSSGMSGLKGMMRHSLSPSVSVSERDLSFIAPDREILEDATLSMETGRVEKGSVSEQALKYDYTSFVSYPEWVVQWKILPISQKPLTKEDLTIYCPECGAKRKKESSKFCANCGYKF